MINKPEFMSVTIIIPTLNEIVGIKTIIPKIKREWADEWLFVDGGSTDGTIEEIKRLGFRVIFQKGKGLTDAYNEGIKQTKSDYILFFSPDGNNKPDDIPKLINKIKEGHDIVQISRFGKNSHSEDAGIIDRFGNKMFTFLVNIFFGGKITDSLNGFKIIKKNTLYSLNLDAYIGSYEEQICIRAIKKKLEIFEIDSTEPKRLGDKRKMRPLYTGYNLSRQIIKEFIFWKF